MCVKPLNKLTDLVKEKYYYYPEVPTLVLKSSVSLYIRDLRVLEAPIQLLP